MKALPSILTNLGFVLVWGGFIWLAYWIPVSQRPIQRRVLSQQEERLKSIEALTHDDAYRALVEATESMSLESPNSIVPALAMLVGCYLMVEGGNLRRRNDE